MAQETKEESVAQAAHTPKKKSEEPEKESPKSTTEVTKSAEIVELGTGWTASVHVGPDPELPANLAKTIIALEKELGMRIWMCIQRCREERYSQIDADLVRAAFDATQICPNQEKIALVIDSPGGFAKSAYQYATCIRRHCGGYVAIVPKYAKSAATLLALGGDSLILGDNAEIGPLDVQVWDANEEEFRSGLDEVQALERLNALGLEIVDTTMMMLLGRTAKKTEKLLPHCLQYSAQIMAPLLEKIDTVHFSGSSRLLKEAEEYAKRLLQPKYNEKQAREIAEKLVWKYPVHSFVIDVEECDRIGIQTEAPDDKLSELLNEIAWNIDDITAVGFLTKVG